MAEGKKTPKSILVHGRAVGRRSEKLSANLPVLYHFGAFRQLFFVVKVTERATVRREPGGRRISTCRMNAWAPPHKAVLAGV